MHHIGVKSDFFYFFLSIIGKYACVTQQKNTTLNTGCCMYEILKCHSNSFVLCYTTDKVILVKKKSIRQGGKPHTSLSCSLMT